MTNTQPVGSAALDERYGRAKTRGVDRVVLIVFLSIVAAGVVIWAFFSNWEDANSMEFRDIAHSIADERSVEVTFEVTAPPNSPLACAVEALNPSFATVGWKVIELPPTDKRTQTVTESLVTTNLANTATVKSCWILDPA